MVAVALLWKKGHFGETLVGGCDLKIGLRGKHRIGVTSWEVISIICEELWWGQIRVWRQTGW